MKNIYLLTENKPLKMFALQVVMNKNSALGQKGTNPAFGLNNPTL